jgi:hypothetical protein
MKITLKKVFLPKNIFEIFFPSPCEKTGKYVGDAPGQVLTLRKTLYTSWKSPQLSQFLNGQKQLWLNPPPPQFTIFTEKYGLMKLIEGVQYRRHIYSVHTKSFSHAKPCALCMDLSVVSRSRYRKLKLTRSSTMNWPSKATWWEEKLSHIKQIAIRKEVTRHTQMLILTGGSSLKLHFSRECSLTKWPSRASSVFWKRSAEMAKMANGSTGPAMAAWTYKKPTLLYTYLKTISRICCWVLSDETFQIYLTFITKYKCTSINL